jgi:acylphosphatase
MGEVTRRYLITGKVQGVFFRQSTRIEAERLQLSGMARNLPDGSVEVIARGESAQVDELRAWLEQGPSHAQVAQVVEQTDAQGASIPVPGKFVVR